MWACVGKESGDGERENHGLDARTLQGIQNLLIGVLAGWRRDSG